MEKTRRLFRGRQLLIAAVAAVGLLASASPAHAIPAFARKYGTSCETCHTVYPKLTPFGEAFRRNGFRFPGTDSDMVKQEPVSLGQEAYKKRFPNTVWPGTLPPSVPLALGFNGQAIFHPDKESGGGQADNRTQFTLQDLAAEGHIWAGGSFDDTTTFFGELTFSDTVEIEHARVMFNDLVGPKHLVNVWAGKTFATLTSFGPHSSYVADLAMPPLAVTGLFGATTDSWNTGATYNSVELSGTLLGRADYSAGVNAGANSGIHPTRNLYAHLGYKLGGMTLDGEGAGGTANPERPWEENAITLDAFVYRSVSTFLMEGDDPTIPREDAAFTYGGQARAQFGSLELDSGAYVERHDRGQADGTAVRALAQYNELSYILYPWLVPALRVEFLYLTPEGVDALWDTRIIPGISALIRPNLKLSLVAQFETANGAPDAGWGAAGGFATPSATDPKVPTEIESLALNLAYAF